jgi:hypothetical protein
MKPFRMTEAPSPQTQKTTEAAPDPAPGTKVVHSRETGQPLPTPSELQARQHGHSNPIPWPQAGGPDDRKSPMKFGSK